MWKTHWGGAIPGIHSPKGELLLAYHEGGLHGVCPKMRQMPTIFTGVKSPSRRAHFNDQPMVIRRFGDWSNQSTLQRKR